jgi:hypothetical protein
MTTSIYLGIDPGKTGAIAAITADREVLLLADLPLTDDGETLDAKRLLDLLQPLEAYTRHLVIEKPWQGLSICVSYGICLAVGQMGCTSVLQATARSWKASRCLSSNKNESVARARASFEGLPKRLRHDKAEALLLAEYRLLVATEQAQ